MEEPAGKITTRIDPSRNFYSKRHWSYQEDKLLYQLVEENGARNWNSIAENMQGRSGITLSHKISSREGLSL